MSQRFTGHGKLYSLGAPRLAAIEVEFEFTVKRSVGATSSGRIIPVGGSGPLERGHYTLVTKDGHRHQVMNLGDDWQLLAPPG